MQKLTPDQYIKLKLAEALISDVQVEIRTDDWRELYRIRCEFGRFIFDRRSEDWQVWVPLNRESKALYDSVVSRLQRVASSAT